MAYNVKGIRLDFIISDNLTNAIHTSLDKSNDDYINYHEIFVSPMREKLKNMGINANYCIKCHSFKLLDEFSESDNSICNICIAKPTRVTAELSREAMAKTKGKCAICSKQTTTIHHIIPKRYGGKDEIDNLICLCSSCHIKAHNGSYAHDKGYNLEIAEKCKTF